MKASGTLKQIRRAQLAEARKEHAEAINRKDWSAFIRASLKIQSSKP